jgi:hypothetical protein
MLRLRMRRSVPPLPLHQLYVHHWLVNLRHWGVAVSPLLTSKRSSLCYAVISSPCSLVCCVAGLERTGIVRGYVTALHLCWWVTEQTIGYTRITAEVPANRQLCVQEGWLAGWLCAQPLLSSTNIPALQLNPLIPWCPVVTICTASLAFNNSAFCPHSVFMCFVWIWEQTVIISLFNINWLSINWLVCTTQTECVYCAVRAEQTAITSLYSINVFVCPRIVYAVHFPRGTNWTFKHLNELKASRG